MVHQQVRLARTQVGGGDRFGGATPPPSSRRRRQSACRTGLNPVARPCRAARATRAVSSIFDLWRKDAYNNPMPYTSREKQNEWARKWLKARKKAWLKRNGPCACCGSWRNLQVDHRDASTKITHNVWSWRRERRELELNKCQVLCRTCHKEKTAREKWEAAPHGTQSKYTSGCRCAECGEAHNKSTREWRYMKGLRVPGGKSWRRRG